MQWSLVGARDGEPPRLVVVGDVDLEGEERLVEAVATNLPLDLAGGDAPLVLDLSGVDFMDSSGIRALARIRQTHGERVRLGDVSPSVVYVLRVSGMWEEFGRGDVG